MATQPAFASIPHPPQKPILGNILDLDRNAPVQSLIAMAREQGPIFALNMMGKPLTVVSGFSLVDELCDEKRFDKSVRGALHKVRAISGDGLFTAYTSEPNWSKAHNILLPNFGSRAMQGYFPIMLDVAEELMLKWQRLNPEDEIDVGRDMTALTLDTIGICGFGYRFNSFYREQFHPFVIAMVEALGIVMSERGLPFEERFNKRKRLKLQADAAAMNAIVDRIISDRKNEPASGDGAKSDLLDYMLSGVDKKTGERLDDTNIRYQIITFLIAGHETTSGLLAFAVYFLLNNPAVLKRAYEEVDRVLGTDPSQKPTLKQVNALTYIGQILKESLRLWPTAPAFGLLPYRDEVIGGRYPLKDRSQVLVLLPMLHRDRSVWGERAELFDPENFSPEAEAARPPNAYKPFGNGQRACIGRQFALQEATLVIGMMLQRFELIDHERYPLRLKETLTLKLEGLKIKARPRVLAQASATAVAAAAVRAPDAAAVQTNGVSRVAASVAERPRHGTPLLVLFGSNLGTAEEVARQVGETSRALGFEVRVGWLDDFVGALPTDGAVLIVCASYNGAPPDNAAAFYKWLQSGVTANSLSGVRYAVFGCGNRNWASTYQSVPRFIDERLAAAGAQRL
ncbi:MAG: cytochrome P450, partial [Candidatus Eremiobacteraeota bacterium]|nr:cytochrome P450 [Candidatus Eremiobacteraeota bacterium]